VTEPPGFGVGRRAFLVEDNDRNQRLVRAVLESAGWTVEIASDGENGLVRLAAGLPDVLLLDIGLPHMDGFEVFRRFRQLPGAERTPVIAVTSFAHADEVRRIQESGFTSYLAKPFQVRALLDLVQAVVLAAEASAPDE
jgi:CheY-like chemotaxis protein